MSLPYTIIKSNGRKVTAPDKETVVRKLRKILDAALNQPVEDNDTRTISVQNRHGTVRIDIYTPNQPAFLENPEYEPKPAPNLIVI